MTDTSRWWETFFDEAYISTWTAQGAFESTANIAEHLIELLDLPPGATVLDVPCGFGRFAAPLHRAGLTVTGVDYSEAQIRRARRDHPGPTYYVGDMREPPLGPYDAVLNLFSSFGYFDDPADDVQCLSVWFEVLRPGGQLVLETMHRDRVAWLFDPDNEAVSNIETGRTDWVTGVRTSMVTIGDEVREFRVRLYTATDLVDMIESVGFVDVQVSGDLTGAPLTPSTRLVLRAVRPR